MQCFPKKSRGAKMQYFVAVNKIAVNKIDILFVRGIYLVHIAFHRLFSVYI